jgi:glycosyltransferase involved in cell wall biosynthesis
MKISEVSVFLPAYNEEKNITRTVEGVVSVLRKVAGKYEILVIDDGSGDKTGKIADDLAKKYSEVKVFHHHPNMGYGECFRDGFYKSRYSWVVHTDGDGQFDFREFPRFIEKQEETNADLVIGYYLKRAVPFYRKLYSFVWQKIIFLIFGLNVRDIDCAFKLINRKVIQEIPRLEAGRGAFIVSELLIKAQKKGFKFAEVGVHHFPDLTERGSNGADLNVIIGSFVDLFRLWKKLRDVKKNEELAKTT